MYKIIEIFDSIEGEGRRQGLPATFIRLAGCNLRCSWCDTPHSHTNAVFNNMTATEILAKVNKNLKRVTITGGEPLEHDLKGLVNLLLDNGFEVNIETNGSKSIHGLPMHERLFFSIDYKLVSSGMSDKMYKHNFVGCHPSNVIKFVVASNKDILQMQEIVQLLIDTSFKKKEKLLECFVENPFPIPHLYACATSDFDAKKLVDAVVNSPILQSGNVKVYTQLHKNLGVR